MRPPEDVEYQVLLVFPGFGPERGYAEEVIEAALEYLHTHKEKPGMRFAPNVSARLEIVATVEQALDRLESEDDLATMILHDLEEEEKRSLTFECMAREIPVTHTVSGRAPRRKRRRGSGPRTLDFNLLFRKPREGEPRAHQIPESTLTDPLDGDPDEIGERVGQLITVLALGVMEHHWGRH